MTPLLTLGDSSVTGAAIHVDGPHLRYVVGDTLVVADMRARDTASVVMMLGNDLVAEGMVSALRGSADGTRAALACSSSVFLYDLRAARRASDQRYSPAELSFGSFVNDVQFDMLCIVAGLDDHSIAIARLH